jgi:hypothetical protein
MKEILRKNITVAAVLSAQTPDTTNEIMNIRNADIESLRSGSAPVNVEHLNPEDLKEITKSKDHPDKDFAGFDSIVGRVVNAKKIFGPDDCDNQMELNAWNKLEVPLIFGLVEFFDGPDATDNQKAAASLVRMAHKNGFDHMIKFSVEGQILKRQGNELTETVIKRIAATAKPANRAAEIIGVVQDTSQNSDAIFKAEKDDITLHKSVLFTQIISQDDFGLSEALFKLRKALDAGTPSAAPSSLVGGASLQPQPQTASLLNLTSKKRVNKKLLKKLMPEANDEQLIKVLEHLKRIKLKKNIEDCQAAFEQLSK